VIARGVLVTRRHYAGAFAVGGIRQVVEACVLIEVGQKMVSKRVMPIRNIFITPEACTERKPFWEQPDEVCWYLDKTVELGRHTDQLRGFRFQSEYCGFHQILMDSQIPRQYTASCTACHSRTACLTHRHMCSCLGRPTAMLPS
jgi:hypothetical protein